MDHMKDSIDIMDDIMNYVSQTDFWNNIQLTDPMIQNADEELTAQLAKLKGIVPDGQIENLRSRAWYLVNAFTYPAILYGMRVAQAIQDVTADPAALSQRILDRVAARNAK